MIGNLDPNQEIFFAWNSAFVNWHNNIFDKTKYPKMIFENIWQIENMLCGHTDRWTIIPASVAQIFMNKKGYKCSIIDNNSTMRTIVLLSKIPVLSECHDILLEASRECLISMPGVYVHT